MGNRVIVPDKIKAMTAEMKTQYEEMESNLTTTKTYLGDITARKKLKGKTADKFRTHMGYHVSVIDVLITFCQKGAEDCESLDNIVGFERLDEKQLEEQLEEVKDSITSMESELDEVYAAMDKWYVKLFGWDIYSDMARQLRDSIANAKELKARIEAKLEKIEEISLAANKLFSTTNFSTTTNAINDLKTGFDGTDFVSISLSNINYLKTAVKPPVADPKGERIGVEPNFVKITGAPDGRCYGGNQGWFDSEYKDLGGYGCGVIAAVNEYLYLTGQTEISYDEYKKLCYEYLAMYPLTSAQLATTLGADPACISGFIEKKCKEDGIKSIDAGWTWTSSDQYDDMKKMLENGIPVVWGLYFMNDSVTFNRYNANTGTYENAFANDWKVSSHYVTATGIYETTRPDGTTQRMVEISSWGEKYYVDYDEYLKCRNETNITEMDPDLQIQYYQNGGIDVEAIANQVGSNVVKVEIE